MSRGRWVGRFLILFALAFANLNDIWSPDVLPNALFAWTVIKERNVDYDEFVFRPDQPSVPGKLDSEAYFFRACGVSTAAAPPKAPRSAGGPPAPGPKDHVCSVFPPGMAIVALPFFAPFVFARFNALDLGLLVRMGHVVGAFVEVLATLVLWSIVRRFVGPRWSVVLVLLYFLGTSVRTIASQALWQHSGVHLAIAIALSLVLREEPVGLGRDMLAGFWLGLGTVVRQTTALVTIGIGGLRPLRLIAGLVGAAIGVAPLLAYNYLAFGSPLEQGYGTKPFDTPIAVGLYGLLFSPSRGLFVYTPWVIFSLVALLRAWRWPGEVAVRLRALSLVWLGTLVLYATYAEWWGGRVFGSRFLDDLAPLLIAALGWAIGVGLLRTAIERVVFALAAAWSFILFNSAAFLYDQSWDTVPVNVNVDPSKLFNWADPQWLAVLRMVPDAGPKAIAGAVLTLLLLILLLRIELRASPAGELASNA